MTILKKVKGGWVNIQHEDLYYERVTHMITQERKSKYKHKITVPYTWAIGDKSQSDMINWCTNSYGPGGRRNRWRFGWTDKDATFYFRSSKDAMMFVLRWSS